MLGKKRGVLFSKHLVILSHQQTCGVVRLTISAAKLMGAGLFRQPVGTRHSATPPCINVGQLLLVVSSRLG